MLRNPETDWFYYFILLFYLGKCGNAEFEIRPARRLGAGANSGCSKRRIEGSFCVARSPSAELRYALVLRKTAYGNSFFRIE
jgi:hypothetical protein